MPYVIGKPINNHSKFNRQAKPATWRASGKIRFRKRINKAADDAAGLQIANRLTSEINQNQQLSFNAQDQANLNDIEGAALSAINEGLLRAQELSIQSGNPLYSGEAIQGELNQITEQINILASDVLGQDNFISGLDANDPSTTQTILRGISTLVNDTASALGAETNALVSQVATYQTSIINVSTSRARIEDTDFAAVTSEQENNAILLQSAIITKTSAEARKGILFNKLV